MKRFIYKDGIIKTSKTYGYSVVECTIYAIKNNKVMLLGTCQYNTASTMGGISEVNKFLLDNKIICKTWSKRGEEKTNYYNCNNGKYTIREV